MRKTLSEFGYFSKKDTKRTFYFLKFLLICWPEALRAHVNLEKGGVRGLLNNCLEFRFFCKKLNLKTILDIFFFTFYCNTPQRPYKFIKPPRKGGCLKVCSIKVWNSAFLHKQNLRVQNIVLISYLVKDHLT